jgi:lipoic acid synthetase
MPENQSEKKSRSPFPPWLKKQVPCNPNNAVRECLTDLNLDTVCRSARCPNQLECFQKRRATFLLMGPSCTRNCRFCAVDRDAPAPLDPQEPRHVAEAVQRLKLKHAVITSVTRDDLPDGGAEHFAQTVKAVRELNPGATIEILTPDFRGVEKDIATAADSLPDVFNHNVETVPRLYPRVRPMADFAASVEVLRFVKKLHPKMTTKSGIMVGLGEEYGEILEAGKALAAAGVDMLTVGQYLQSAPGNLPVERFVTPEEFARMRRELKDLGFRHVAAAPFVRSSYNAEEALEEISA